MFGIPALGAASEMMYLNGLTSVAEVNFSTSIP